MPIFEFLCPRCNRIYSFLSLSVNPSREPVCPRCGAANLTRVPSAFAVATEKKSERARSKDGAAEPDEAAMARVEQEMMRMGELDDKDAEDPRTMARMMRRLAEASGERMTPTMEEMFRRLESGEDPDALEEELGPQLEAEMGDDAEGAAGGAPTRDEGLYNL